MVHLFYLDKLNSNRLFRDSFWAVMGNGLGNFLLLLSGILIARLLGKDLYGEYGMVKTTMFYLALFATLSLGNTSTKFIAEYIVSNPKSVFSVVRDSFRITLFTSLFICLLLFVLAKPLAVFIKAPQLSLSFRYLGVIIVFRAIATVGAGVLAGFKDFKHLGINNVLSGLAMVVICVPLTKFFLLSGALISLFISQILSAVLNSYRVIKVSDFKVNYSITKDSSLATLLNFTYPFAIAEFIFTAASFGTNLIVTRYSSLGELGMFTACSQWNSIILFIPGLLGNVILSHLSSTAAEDSMSHSSLIRRMLLINFVCTIVPLFLVLMLSPYIVRYYGPTFVGMGKILAIMISSTVFICLARVFQAELTSVGEKWRLMIIRCSYNLLQLVLAYLILVKTGGANAALNMAYITVFINALSLIMYYSEYRLRRFND